MLTKNSNSVNSPISSESQSEKVSEVAERLLSMGLSPLPVAPRNEEILDSKGKPIFTGKNPSFVDQNGNHKIVNHKQYQDRQPTQAELNSWFPPGHQNGIGCLGSKHFRCIDFDAKQVRNPTCGCAVPATDKTKPPCKHQKAAIDLIFNNWREMFPQVGGTWVEETQGSGYRMLVESTDPTDQDEFTNFALANDPSNHIGEVLGYGRFAVLAPSKGIFGAYKSISDGEPVKVAHLSDLGIISTARSTKPRKERTAVGEQMTLEQAPIFPTDVIAVPLEKLVCAKVLHIYQGKFDLTECDRSALLSECIREVIGWQNVAEIKKLPIEDSEAFIEQCYENIYGDNPDWKKIDRVTETLFKDYDRSELEPARCLHDSFTDAQEDFELKYQLANNVLPDDLVIDPSEKKKSSNNKRSFGQIVIDELYQTPHICVSGVIYRWTGDHYQLSKDGEELKRIQLLADKVKVWDQRNNVYKFPYATAARVKEALEWAKQAFHVDPELTNPSGLNCTNGVLQISYSGRLKDVAKFTLVPHDPCRYYLYEPMATYDESADPKDCDRLLAALEEPQQKVFLKTIAASLDLDNVRRRHGRAVRGLLNKGVGANGKDAIGEAVKRLFGLSGVVSASFEDFEQYDQGRKFPLSKLREARINWSSENRCGVNLDKLQSLKKAITGEDLYFELKGVKEEPFTPKSIQVFNVNDVPNIKAGMQAIKDRFAVLSFDKIYRTKPDHSKGELEADPRFKYDPDFIQNNVLSALLNKLITAFKDLMLEGIDYSCCDEAMQRVQIHNSHLLEFAHETGLAVDRDSVIPVKELWEALEHYYLDTGVIDAGEFGKRVWAEPIRPGDQYVKSSNQVINRFLALFPQCEVVSVGHRVKGIKGLAFVPVPRKETIAETEPEKVQLEQSPTNVGDLPDWVKVESDFLNGSKSPIKIAAIEQTSEGVYLIDPTGDRHLLSDCKPSVIPANIQ